MKKLLILLCLLSSPAYAAIQELDLTVTNSSTLITSLTGGTKAPQNAQYVSIENPSATASMAFNIIGSTPAVNGIGVTLSPLGSYTFDNPAGSTVPLASLQFISSIASQPVTVFWH